MTIKVLKTDQMTTNEKEAVCILFKNVFNIEKTYDQFIHQFENNEFGYSYFGLIFYDEMIVGSYAVIPLKYNYFGRDVVFGQSVDTMINENYRGNPFLLKKLAEKVYERLQEDNINFVFGFPNDNIYLVRKKILRWKDIDNLDIYLLPIRIGTIKSILRPFNFLGYLMVKTLNYFVKNEMDKSERFDIYKQNSSQFKDYRFTDEYIKINLSENRYCFYKIQEFNNIKTAFIVDVFPLTKRNLELAVKNIYKSGKQIDLIAYFGFLPFNPINLFKVPEKYKPKDTFMSGRILNSTKISKDIFDVKNWRVNLSNFDWI